MVKLSSIQNIPGGVDKLSFELVNLEMNNMSCFWGALGTQYQPSVLYKMRLLIHDSDVFLAKIPEFDKPEVPIKTK